MEELLKLKSLLDKIDPEKDDIPLELLEELNQTLQYALGWCRGWLTPRAADLRPQRRKMAKALRAQASKANR